jgi:UDP-glucose 4-epimerase
MRVLITGLGGQLGTRVAQRLEDRAEVEAIVGMDAEPPRHRLLRTDFHRIDPRDRARTVSLVRRHRPTALVHVGTYEPHARATPRAAEERTLAGTAAVIAAASESPELDRIVVRSGIEVYGRGPGTPSCPDESVTPAPTSPFGRSLLHAEDVAVAAGRAASASVTCLRLATVVGPHFPSPLGRYLRLPVVPVSACRQRPFSLLHQDDAAAAIVAAALAPYDGPLNVVADGAVTGRQAARLGRRVPVPVWGPGWVMAKAITEVVGSPLPDHVQEMLVRGRMARSDRAPRVLGTAPRWSTEEVVGAVYEWPSVTFFEPDEARGAA